MILKIEARRLGFHSVAEYVEILNKVRLKKAWSGLDLQILAEYGKLPEISIMTEEQLKNKGYKKIAESEGKPFMESMPTITVEVKPKPSKKAKKKESK